MDYSFLRLERDFQKVRINENFLTAKVIENVFVQQFPNETFLQISNSDSDIAFGGNILIELVDCREDVKFTFELNNNFFIEEFEDRNGVKQIAYEFGNVGIDFGRLPLYLKLSHTVSDKVWYSAPFIISYQLFEETSVFEYKNESYYRGISYEIANYFQRVRLIAFDNDIDAKIESKGYTELSGDEISYRQQITKIVKGKFAYCNNFIFDRIVTLFSHDILYINGFRVNNKPSVKKGDKLGTSNFFQLDYEYNPSEEFRAYQYQIYQGLEVVNKIPEGDLSLSEFNTATATSTLFQLQFNKTFVMESDISATIYKDDVLFASIPSSKFSINDKTLEIDVTDYPITAQGIYNVVIPPNKISKDNDQWQGFENGDWEFIIDNSVLTITSVTNTSGSNYSIAFTANFSFVQLYSQVKWDELPNWSNPLLLSGTSSPQSRIISGGGTNKKVRIFAVNIATGLTIYSNEHPY